MHHSPLISEKTEGILRETFLAMRTDRPIRVPSERALAESLGISRVSIRKALQALMDEGLLDRRQGMGTYVRPNLQPSAIHVLCSPEIKPDDPFYLKFLSALTTHAAKSGTSLSMRRLDHPPEGSSAEPLILLGPVNQEDAFLLEKAYRRIVSVHDGNVFRHASEIRFDDRNIGRAAARILLNAGFRNLGILAGPARYDSASERRAGFLEVSEAEALPVRLLVEKMNWGGGIRAAESLVRDMSEKGLPEALFAANDWMALGCMQKLRESGIRVPEDISVLGCDNIPLAAEFHPALATFDLDMNRLVAEIFEKLAETRQVGDKEREGAQAAGRLLLPATFIRRASLGRKD